MRAYGRSEKSRSELRCRVLCKRWILLMHRLHSATATDDKKTKNEGTRSATTVRNSKAYWLGYQAAVTYRNSRSGIKYNRNDDLH